jgi:protein involved in polysaccharide export with SLBB domain
MKTTSTIHRLAHLPIALSILAATVFIFLTGCETQSSQYSGNPAMPARGTNDIVLREADVVSVVFPGAENLNTSQAIRRDGKITLPAGGGEITAAGKTPSGLQKELVTLYAKELVSSKDIVVTVQSASFPVFITGAVQRPGKIISDHPMTVLEAIMESGGFDYLHANMKKVRIIRIQDKKTFNFTVNLKGVANGTEIDVFYLQPSDIVFVPSKITWF